MSPDSVASGSVKKAVSTSRATLVPVGTAGQAVGHSAEGRPSVLRLTEASSGDVQGENVLPAAPLGDSACSRLWISVREGFPLETFKYVHFSLDLSFPECHLVIFFKKRKETLQSPVSIKELHEPRPQIGDSS